MRRRPPPQAPQAGGGAHPYLACTAQLVTDDGHASEPGLSFLVGRAPRPWRGERSSVLFALPDRLLGRTHARIDVSPNGTVTVTDRGGFSRTVVELDDETRPAPAHLPTAVPDGARIILGGVRLTVIRSSS